MDIKFTESELQFLSKSYGDENIQLEFTDTNEFSIHHPKAKIPCEIIAFTSRSIRIQYKLGFFKNLLVNMFVNFELEGIIWDKREKYFDIHPFSFLPEKERLATKDFRIDAISLEPGSFEITMGIIPEKGMNDQF